MAGSGGGGEQPEFGHDRREHGARLVREYERAMSSADDEEEPGAYITFESFPGLELALESLDPQRSGAQPELVVVRDSTSSEGKVQQATVYVPNGKKAYFLDRLTAYVDSLDGKSVRHSTLVEGIRSIRRATIRELWTDADDVFPVDDDRLHWWEVWLRRRNGGEVERVTALAAERGLRTSGRYLGFGDRTVLLVQATVQELAEAFAALDDIAELRKPHEVANLLAEMSAAEQGEWVADLSARVQPAGLDAPAVCVLDTGVQDGHLLLAHSLSASDLHGLNGVRSAHARERHGTEMAGLALYGDLHGAVVGSGPVQLTHRLESVRILGGPDEERELQRPRVQRRG